MCYIIYRTLPNFNHFHSGYYYTHEMVKKENLSKIKCGVWNQRMNIVKSDTQNIIEAKTSGCNKKKSITYYFVESAHSLCLDKSEIILAQIQACERLLNYTKDNNEIISIEKEILGLNFALDLIQFS